MCILGSAGLTHLASKRGLAYQSPKDLPSLLTEDLLPVHLLQHERVRQDIMHGLRHLDPLSLEDMFVGMGHSKQETQALTLKQLTAAIVSEILQASR